MRGIFLTPRHFPAGTAGQSYWYHLDGRGSVAGLTKHQGQATHNYRYDAYGQLLPAKGNWTDPHNHYTFSGKEWDEHLDSYEFGYRQYDPAAGVWLTQDPLRGEPSRPRTLHRYQYVFASPISYRDAYGLQVEPLDCEPGEICYTGTTGPYNVPSAPYDVQSAPYTSLPTGARWVDKCVRLFGLGAGDKLELPFTDFINWDILVGRVIYRYGVHAEIKGQGSSVTIFPDRIKLGPLTVTEDGKVTTRVTPFTLSHGPVSHKGQIGLTTYPSDFSSCRIAYSGRGKTEMEGEQLSVSVSQTVEMELEIRPRQLAVVPVVVALFYLVPQLAQQISEQMQRSPAYGW